MEVGKGVEMEHSPDSVLPPPHPFRDSEKRNTRLKPPRRDEILRVKEGFTEISFRRYRSSSCKNFSSRPLVMGDSMEQRRGSVYQSSNEAFKETRFSGSNEAKAKLELSRASDASFSFRIVDSSRTGSAGRSPQNDLSDEPKSAASSFIDICLNSGIKDRAAVLDSDDELNVRCDEAAGPLNEYNHHKTRLPKSQSAKVETLSVSPSESNCNRESSRAQFGHIRKMFDPFVKSKSLRSPLGYLGESREFKVECTEKMLKGSDHCKALFSENSEDHEKLYNSPAVMNKDRTLALISSPVHLHACLKLENKDGLPVFRFFLDSPEEVYVAKTWKSNNGSKWTYTFSCVGSRKKSNASVWGLNDCSRESSQVGQMQVSCYTCLEPRKNGQDPDKLMVTEFVLYDIAHARRSVSAQENSSRPKDTVKVSKSSAKPDSSSGSSEPEDGSDVTKQRLQPKSASESFDLYASKEPKPWPDADLHPDLEIAAIIIQDQIGKRESLKYRGGDQRVTDKRNLLSLSPIEEGKKYFCGSRSPEKLKVIIPRGNHGIPTSEYSGPSPLLQRWSSGGGCDCGGWDMACPLVVFGNSSLSCSHDQPLMGNHHPLELFVQGAKENTPALSMTFVKEGQYDVHFHAQLSTLQTFSICVAILHNLEAPGDCRNGENIQLSQCNSLKMLIEDEVKCLVEAVTEDEKQVTKPVKGSTATLQSYMPNPPISPISRV
ncbi:PREDICTED: uncharacterized protein LOC104814560 [Tarenaya hassleriana]|uniref:uncharacterized protein LOC104814560 n=1 Tax=Tarenaya hassleriana TaxID=28532 RepID=UPI00053C08BB|nr:PREDICTED: uncharacterized protein LOC104814560 [Tarenaya hassleriana]XP_010540978.1 PREDICTED: uncharacterized protein LOC104814560 [Tarenaya hassleriana]